MLSVVFREFDYGYDYLLGIVVWIDYEHSDMLLCYDVKDPKS